MSTRRRARGLALRYEHTAVARWLKGQRPRGQVPDLICEVLAGRLHRPVTLDDIGLGVPGEPSAPHGTSAFGFVECATALWRSDEQQRPHLLGAPAVTGTPAVMPVWEWENPPEDVDVSRGGRHHVSMADIEMLRAARAHYEQMYRKAGGVVNPQPDRRFPQRGDRAPAARQLSRRHRPPAPPCDGRPGRHRGDLCLRLRRARARPALLPPGAAAGEGQRGPGLGRTS